MKVGLGFSLLLTAVTLPLHAQGGYGTKVAVGEGVVYVAEPGNIARPGIVYAYTRGADGRWVEAAKVTAQDAVIGDQFGIAIAASGNTLIASRLADDARRGAAFVFERRGQRWVQTGKLSAGDAAPNDSVGMALAVHGDVALVGAAGPNRAGAVYVFRRGAGGAWAQEARLTASDGQPGDHFGAALATDGQRIIVGAPAQARERGGAYLFMRTGDGAWKEEARLVSRTVKEGDGLGTSVALMRGWAIAAAPGRDEATGAVYLFEPNPQSPGTWAAFTRLFPYEGSSQARFGNELGVVGDELWISSPGADQFKGTIYRFQWNQEAGDWLATRKLSYPEAPQGAGFGFAFAVGGSQAIAGLPNDDHGEGTAVVLARGSDGEWRAQGKVFSEPESFPRVTGKPATCSAGKATVFECGNVELLGFLPIKEIGGERGIQLNDIWGWTDPRTNREYALVGRTNGTSFVDVTDPSSPVYLGDLPMTKGATVNAWRDIKVYKDHAYVVADGAGKHGMQVFDLSLLRNVKNAPVTFEPVTTYDRIYSAHNIVINEDKGFAFAVGSNGGGESCGGGLHMIDIREPKNPKFAGCFADTQTGIQRTGYTHDAQCVTYKGPDAKYAGREICLNSNETALSISDVTDKARPIAISHASYPNVAYSHQGWLTDDQRYFYMDDEGDEMNGSVKRTRTLIWDVSDLDDPQLVGEYLGETGAIDHNLYIKGDTMYESNYAAGLRVIDITDRRKPREVGFLDSVPSSENNAVFQGSWSNYPYFKSGTIVFSSIREGLFIVKMQKPKVVS